MLISGLSFIRNGIALGYPFVEAIRSILPLVDEMVVVVGESTDGTREAVEAIGDPRIRIIDSIWHPRITPKASVLAHQTNLGLLSCRGDWVVYVQGNELFHERDLPRMRALMTEHLDNPEVEGLLIERLVFYGDYRHFIRTYPDRFKYVVRAFKPWNGVYAITSAMTFSVFESYGERGRALRCIDSGVDMFRYGKLLTPEAMTWKLRNAPHKLRGDDARFDADAYYRWIARDCIRRYPGDHPAVMYERIARHPIALDLDDPRWRTELTGKERRRLIESAFYRRFGLPKWRKGRYRLVGDFVPKDRSAEQ
jgi:glycosyltransferase involved in cell wall biosynthesis